MKLRFQPPRIWQRLSSLGIFTLAVLPALNILWIISSTGANTPSNDYLRMIHVVDQILSGGYDWSHYFRDTLQNYVHSYAFLFLVRLGIIRLTHWDIYAELYLGWALSVLKVFLLYYLISRPVPSSSRKWLWLPLTALVFSTSQISMFTFGETALQQGLIQVAILLGLVALSHKPGLWRVVGVASCGVMASWSGGGGLVAWPLFLIGMVLNGYRKVSQYLIWLSGCAIAAWPYIAYGALGNPGGFLAMASLEKIGIFITALGLPFANQIGSGGLTQHAGAFKVGLFALALALTGCLLVWAGARKQNGRNALPTLLLMLWGVMNATQTVLSRLLLAPWYTTAFMPFWYGMVGLASIFVAGGDASNDRVAWRSDNFGRLRLLWGFLALASLLVLYLDTNLTYRDKSFYLASRSPASAACLRNFVTAPTYCEGLVFQWGVGHPTYLADLAWPLEKHRLSVFGPQQQWTLQGDYVLARVRVYESPGVPGVTWTPGWTDQVGTWADDRHLNLFLHAPNAIAWVIDLPPDLLSAVFKTAVAVDKAAPVEQNADGFEFQVYLQPEGEPRRQVFAQYVAPGLYRWQQVSLPLTEFAGKSLSLVLTSNGRSNLSGDRVMLRYPRIDLSLATQDLPVTRPEITPSNTELYTGFPGFGAGDFRLDAYAPDIWRVSGVHPAPDGSRAWVIDQAPIFELRNPVDLCLKDYSHFYMRLLASQDISPLAVRVYYKLGDQTDFTIERSFWIPLLADEQMHTYLYAIKLLDIPAGTHLTGLRLVPGVRGKPEMESKVEIAEIGFLKKEVSGFCDFQPQP